VRKIISILVALGLVLAFSAVAVPTTAALPACSGNMSIDNPCADAEATYNINFTAPVTLIPGNDLISVAFGGNTSLAAVAANASLVTVNGTMATNVTVSGPDIEIWVPGASMFLAGTIVEVEIAKVKNPVGGTYNLTLDYKQICCAAVDFCYMTYTIKPSTAVYGLGIDFGPTYPGIAVDFVPPFKACGQNSSGTDFTTYYNATLGVFFEPFNLMLKVTTPGCAVPCVNATLMADVTGIPSGGKVTLNISGHVETFNSTYHAANFTSTLALNETTGENISSEIHFDTPGKGYNLYVKVFCPGGTGWTGICPDCVPPGQDKLVAENDWDFDVYQWKDAYKVILDEKWNLISLPLVPLVDPPIADLLASINPTDRAQIDSIWYYDNCADVPEADKWSMWPGGGLTDLFDGKAYWLKVLPYPQGDCGNITWWVWGTTYPMPPAAPAQYDVCEGWNMVGFLGNAANVSAYLWNWGTPTPVVYGWSHGCFASQGWVLKTAGDSLTLGQGYWMAFSADGAVYVP
jgi:hypothetical protein